MGPIIDEKQRDNIHRIVTSTVESGARLAAGGTYDNLFYKATVLADVPVTAPAYTEEIFGPVAPITAFGTIEEAARMAADTPYGLSVGIITGDPMKDSPWPEKIPTGLIHINDQTIVDEPGAFRRCKTIRRRIANRRRRSQHRSLHRIAVGDDADRRRAVSFLEFVDRCRNDPPAPSAF